MQQRPAISARSLEHEQYVMVVKEAEMPHQQEKPQCSPSLAERYLCQISASSVFGGKRQSHRRPGFALGDYWVHGIPFTVLLCFFFLCWFSHPVNVVVKNGRIVAIHLIEKPHGLNDTHLDFAILASAESPAAGSVPESLTSYNITHLNPTSPENPID